MRSRDPDDPLKGRAWALSLGVALSIASMGLLVWMALDVDNDGQASYQELRAGTSPMNGDSDGDGVADGWEYDHGYDALSAASSPHLEGAESAGEMAAACTLVDSIGSACGAEAESGSEQPVIEETPPAGGNGLGTTSVLGVTTTVVASVFGRVIAVRVLHS